MDYEKLTKRKFARFIRLFTNITKFSIILGILNFPTISVYDAIAKFRRRASHGKSINCHGKSNKKLQNSVGTLFYSVCSQDCSNHKLIGPTILIIWKSQQNNCIVVGRPVTDPFTLRGLSGEVTGGLLFCRPFFQEQLTSPIST